MPIYEYRHKQKPKNCKDPFEHFASIKDDALSECPLCGAPVERILSTFTGKANIFADANLKEKGFTKLVKDDVKGGYRKV